jgi:hypothetical protein
MNNHPGDVAVLLALAAVAGFILALLIVGG